MDGARAVVRVIAPRPSDDPTPLEIEVTLTRTVDCDALVATLERYGVPFRVRVAMMDNDGNPTAWRVLITTRPA